VEVELVVIVDNVVGVARDTELVVDEDLLVDALVLTDVLSTRAPQTLELAWPAAAVLFM